MEYSGYLYHCSAGETFDGIALAVYGDEKYAADLMTANPGHVMTLVFVGGEMLALPVVEKPEDNTGAGDASSTAPWKQ